MAEIFNDSIEAAGFYFVDHLVDRDVAAVAYARTCDRCSR